MKLISLSSFFITFLLLSGITLAITDEIGDTSAQDHWNNYILAYKYIPTSDGDLISIGVNFVSSSSNQFRIAIYDDNSNYPNILLAESSSVVISESGWNDINITGVSLVNGQTYWISFQQNSNSPNEYVLVSGLGYYYSYSYNSFPYTFDTGSSISETINTRITYLDTECISDFQLNITNDICFNSTNYEHNTTYYDLNECNISDLWIMNYTYPELEYTFSSSSQTCLNSTDLNVTNTYTDTFPCSYSFSNSSLTYCNYGCSENQCDDYVETVNCPYLQYHFNNESQFTVFDYSPNLYDATLGGSPTFEDGKLGKALKLDAGQYFITGTLTDTAFNYSKPFSISFWFKNLEAGRMVLLARIGDGKGFALGDYYGALTFGLWSIFDSNALQVATQDYGLLLDGNFHFVTYTYDGSGSANGIKIYYDSALKPVDIFADNINGDTIYNSTFGSTYGEQQTYGYIDELQIYNFELNYTQIRTLYNFGNGTENTLCPIPIVPVPPVFYNGSADTSEYLSYYCISNTTLKGNGTYQNQLVETYKTCSYGCIDGVNVCSPSDFIMIIFIFLVGIVILYISLWFKRNVLR